MNINTIDTNQMRNHKHCQFYIAFRNLVQKFGATALKITPLWNVFLSLFSQEDEALQKIMGSAITPQIRAADEARDEAFRGISEFNRAMCRYFAAGKRAAALRLKVVFKTYGDVAVKPLNEETSAIYNLVQDLLGEKYVEDVKAVGLFDWVMELQRLNTTYNTLVEQRFQETGERCDINLKAKRAEVDVAYKDIVKMINSLIVVEGETDYKAFVDNMNAIIAKYKVKSPHHHGGGAEEEEEEGEGGEAA